MKRTRNSRKPEAVKLGNIVVNVYLRAKLHKVKDDARKLALLTAETSPPARLAESDTPAQSNEGVSGLQRSGYSERI